MQHFVAGQANIVTVDMVAKASGNAITTGTVTAYLIADTGTNAGKWFQASDSTWQAAEASAGAAAYKGGAAWQVSIVAAAWTSNVEYTLYGTESGALHVPYSDKLYEIQRLAGPGDIDWDYTLTDDDSGLPIADATITVSTDASGSNVVARGTTSALGVVTFYLYAGTYYIWRVKSGYTFDDPDTEVVA